MPGRVFPIASDSNHHILFTVQQISNGRGISTGRKGMSPKNPAGGFIKGTNFFISGGGDKEDVSCRQGRPPKFRVPVFLIRLFAACLLTGVAYASEWEGRHPDQNLRRRVPKVSVY